MRAPLIVGLFACVVMAASHSSTASAQALDNIFVAKQTESTQSFNVIEAISLKSEPVAAVTPTVEQPQPPQPVTYTVQANDTLTSVAEHYQTDWKRLFNKNTSLASPDVLSVGTVLTIPQADEQLTDRPLPVIEQATVAAPQPATKAVAAPKVSYYRGTSAGNTYAPGWCTWYAKNMRPDLPNNLGNANTWVSRAAAQGIATGSVPRAGAIGQQGMHVVYVQRVNGDGTIFISEMNYAGLYVISTRTVAASNFMYIY